MMRPLIFCLAALINTTAAAAECFSQEQVEATSVRFAGVLQVMPAELNPDDPAFIGSDVFYAARVLRDEAWVSAEHHLYPGYGHATVSNGIVTLRMRTSVRGDPNWKSSTYVFANDGKMDGVFGCGTLDLVGTHLILAANYALNTRVDADPALVYSPPQGACFGEAELERQQARFADVPHTQPPWSDPDHAEFAGRDSAWSWQQRDDEALLSFGHINFLGLGYATLDHGVITLRARTAYDQNVVDPDLYPFGSYIWESSVHLFPLNAPDPAAVNLCGAGVGPAIDNLNAMARDAFEGIDHD